MQATYFMYRTKLLNCTCYLTIGFLHFEGIPNGCTAWFKNNMVIGNILHFYQKITKNAFYVKLSLRKISREIITVAKRMFWIIEGFSLTFVTKYTHLCKKPIIVVT